MSVQSPVFWQAGNIENWNVYKKLAIVCDVTEFFITHYMPACRTVDQMRQAARSGKQNVVEGLSDNASSFEICYKLIGVARGSLRELREDYKDYLRQHYMDIWDTNSHKVIAWRNYAKSQYTIKDFTQKCISKKPEAIANIMLTLTSQLDTALVILMKNLLEEFQQTGGIKEKLTQLRLSWRNQRLN